MSDSILRDKSFLFAIRIVKLYKYIKENRHEYILSKQLLRSGTSVGAMVREAKNSESKADFQHKLGIAQKECDESLYWLELLQKSSYIAENEYYSLSFDAEELLKMIRSSILTSKTNRNK
jgi:four helix bundle protein